MHLVIKSKDRPSGDKRDARFGCQMSLYRLLRRRPTLLRTEFLSAGFPALCAS